MIHNKHDKLIIVGAGGHGKVCIDVAEQMDIWKEIKVIDDQKKGSVLNKEIIGSSELIDKDLVEEYDFFVGIGNNRTRKKFIEKILEKRGNIVNLISPNSIIGQHISIGFGNIFMINSVVNTDVKMGNGNIINTSSIIEHDVTVSNYVHVAPNSVVLGHAFLGSCVMVGSNSVVFPKIKIGYNTQIGAMSVVNKEIKPGQKKFGKMI